MENPLVSVIIPTFNRAYLLKKAIYSVLNQTYKNFEIIIVDDGSTDNTEELIRGFENEKIRYFKLEHTGLPAVVRNKGIEECHGELIAFLDSDDFWIPNKLELQIRAFKNHENILLVASRRIILPDKITYHLNYQKRGVVSFRELIRRNVIPTSSVIIRREVIEKVGKFDEDYRLRSGQDFSYWLDILSYRDKSILILKAPLIIFRVHDKTLTFERRQESDFFKDSFYKRKYLILKYEDVDRNYVNSILRKWVKKILLDHRKKLLHEGSLNFRKMLRDNLLTPYEKIKIIIVVLLKKIQMKFLK